MTSPHKTYPPIVENYGSPKPGYPLGSLPPEFERRIYPLTIPDANTTGKILESVIVSVNAPSLVLLDVCTDLITITNKRSISAFFYRTNQPTVTSLLQAKEFQGNAAYLPAAGNWTIYVTTSSTGVETPSYNARLIEGVTAEELAAVVSPIPGSTVTGIAAPGVGAFTVLNPLDFAKIKAAKLLLVTGTGCRVDVGPNTNGFSIVLNQYLDLDVSLVSRQTLSVTNTSAGAISLRYLISQAP